MGESMVGFGYKQAWLAVRTADQSAVIAALGIRDLGPVPWREGIDLSYFTDDRLVLTPPLTDARGERWLLLAGRWLLGPRAAVDVIGLSAALRTEVQFFASYRVSDLHRWQRAVDGESVRVFGYLGETGEITGWGGEPDDVERAIGLPSRIDAETDVLVGEEDVMRVAQAWSIDPSALEGQPAPGPLRAAACP